MNTTDTTTTVTTTPDTVTVADVLNGAADYIEQHGWLQNRLGYDGGPRCALGAFASVSARDYKEAFWAFHGYLGERVVDYNNAAGRTKEDVVAALRAAAALVHGAVA